MEYKPICFGGVDSLAFIFGSWSHAVDSYQTVLGREMSKMDPVIGARWVANLRDGTRTQGQGHLRDANGHQCCLDVLCEDAVNEGVISAPTQNGERYTYEYNSEEGFSDYESSFLPVVVADWAGLDSADPEVVWEEDTHALSALNDTYFMTFAEIADLVEDQLL